MSQSETNNVMEQLEQRRLEMMREQQNNTISISEARRSVTPLESLLPRVSLEQIEQDNDITILFINIRALSFSPLEQLSKDAVLLKARVFSKLKFPTQDIQNINIITSKDIALPFIDVQTGRTLHTIRVNIK